MCYCGKCKNNFECHPCEEPIGTHSLFTDCSQHKGMIVMPRYEVLKYRLHNLLLETENADLLDEFEKIVKEELLKIIPNGYQDKMDFFDWFKMKYPELFIEKLKEFRKVR